MFNTDMWRLSKLNKMEESYARLLKAAKELKDADSPAEVARLLDISDQTIQNWKTRGVPQGKLVKVEARIGALPKWIATGQGRMTPEKSDLTPEQKNLLLLSDSMDSEAREAWVKVGASLTKRMGSEFIDSEGKREDNTPPPDCVCREHPGKRTRR